MIRTLVILILLCSTALGIDRYVDPAAGTDSGTGPIGAPWKTIAYSASHMAAGDTLHMRGGVYTETGWEDVSVNPGFPNGSSSAAPTKIKGYTGETAVWKPTTITTERYLITVGLNSATTPTARSNLWFEGFTVDLSASPLCAGGFHFRSFENVTITNMTFRNLADGYGFVVVAGNTTSPGGTNLTLVNNTFTNWTYANLRDDGKHAVYLKRMQSSRISGNVLTNGHANATLRSSYAIHLYDSQTGYGATTMSTNLIVESNIVDTAHGGVVWSQIDGGSFRNNIIRIRGSLPGFSIGYGPSGLKPKNVGVDNNTFYATGAGSPISIRPDIGIGNLFRNNILWATVAANSIASAGANANAIYVTNNIMRTGINAGVLAVSNNSIIGQDPAFTAAPDDLTWASSSPARNTGTDLSSLFTTDFYGTVRPQESVFDIGAYEWTSGGTLPTVRVNASGSAYENGLVPATFTFTRAESNAGDLTVYFVKTGDAEEGVHYTAIAGSVTILDGQWSATVTVTPLEVPGYFGNVNIRVTISANAAYTISTPSSDEIYIVEADAPPSNVGQKPDEPGRSYQGSRRR